MQCRPHKKTEAAAWNQTELESEKISPWVILSHNNTLSEALCRRGIAAISRGPVAQVYAAPTHHSAAVITLMPESPPVRYYTTGQWLLEEIKDLQENS